MSLAGKIKKLFCGDKAQVCKSPFKEQSELTEKDLDYFCEIMKLQEKRATAAMSVEDFDRCFMALLKNAGWENDKERFGFVYGKIMAVARYVKITDNPENIRKAVAVNFPGLAPTDTEIELIRNKVDRVWDWLELLFKAEEGNGR